MIGDAPYVELHLHTCYSLLEGASSPRQLAIAAGEHRYDALAVTDRNNLYGAMAFARECRDVGLDPILGVELTLVDDPDDDPDAGPATPAGARHHLTLLAETRQGYANLCRLVSLANGWGLSEPAAKERRRLDPCVAAHQVRDHTAGVLCLTGGRDGALAQRVAAGDRRGATEVLARWVEWFGTGNVWVELHDNLVLGDRPRIRAQVALARQMGVPIVATGDVHYHERQRHRLHDALCAIRHRTTLDGCHRQRRPNSEFFLRSPIEQAERFAEWPDAVAATVDIAERCTFRLPTDLGYRLPTPEVAPGHTPDSHLAELCRTRLEARYEPRQQPEARRRLEEELRLISHHGLAGFFLVYHEVLALATKVAAEVRGDAPRGRIGMAPGRGRGSSVSSIVCYLIGLSHIDPVRNHLFLGRFLNEEMPSLPDIDLDFPRDIRDRLFTEVYERWGTDHAALVATFPTYRIRSAVRDLGKALGLPAAELDRLAKLAEGYSPATSVALEMERIPDLAPLAATPGWAHLIELARQLAGFPRHISQHVGGIVISSEPLIDCVPIQPTAWPGRYVCQWDKDDIDDARMVKIDILALGMLSLVEECLDLCHQHSGELVDLTRIPFDEQEVYDTIGRGDTIGVFQIESRAQAGILPRTRPQNLDDLAAQVAIIRPGPIVGGAVHRYVEGRARRRDGAGEGSAGAAGDGARSFGVPHPCVEEALGETFGVVLFQEQVVQVAVAMGGFSPGKAEEFRRAMGRKDWSDERREQYWEKFRAGANEQGVPDEAARQVFDNLTGFAQFGFPKSHAAAFGLLAYQTAWLKQHFPAEFYCALFNNWPMGFYPPHVFTNDARRHDVDILRPEVNTSQAACTVASADSRRAVRLGLGRIQGMGSATAAAIVGERERGGPFRSLRDFALRTELAGEAIEHAIRVGAFDGFGLRRRELLWQLWLLGLGARPGTPRPRSAGGGSRRGRTTGTGAAGAAGGTGGAGGEVRYRQLRLDLPTEQDHVPLTDVSAYQAMADDYELLGLSPDGHPMQFLRPGLPGVVRSTAEVRDVPPGRTVDTAGLVVCRQRPGTAEGAVFLLLEDEHGLVNVMLGARLYERYRLEVRGSPLLRIRGVTQEPAGDVAMLYARSLSPIVPAAALRTPDGKSWG